MGVILYSKVHKAIVRDRGGAGPHPSVFMDGDQTMLLLPIARGDYGLMMLNCRKSTHFLL